MGTRAVIYARVSSDPRGAGRSVAEQEAECRALAERSGWSVERVFVDNDRSASRHARKGRPAFDDLVAHVQDGGCDVVMTWEASRFQRDLEVYVRLREVCRRRGVLWSYSGRTFDLERTDDRLATGLDALLAERESDQTRERVMRATRANAAAGRPHGRLLYGYRREYDPATRSLLAQVPHGEHAAVVREAARRVAAGEPCNAVAADLNARSVPAPRGGRWNLTQVRRLVTNPAYVGQRVHRGKVVGPATWPAILDDATFYRCVSRLTDPARRTVRDGAVRHLLTGLARCGVCGAPVVKQKNRGFDAYLCREGFHVSRRQDHVDNLVTRVVVARLARPDALDALAGRDTSEDAREAAGEAAEKQARLDAFYDAAAAGEVTPAALARIEARLLPEIEAAEQRARRVAVAPVLREVARADIAERWDSLPITVRREVVDLLAEVRILPARRGARTFDPESVSITWRS